MQNGEVVRSVDQITVGGSFFEFLNGVEVIGSDLWMSPPIGPVIGGPKHIWYLKFKWPASNNK